MPNFPSIYLELQELWKRFRSSANDITGINNKITVIENDIADGVSPSGNAGGVLGYPGSTYPNPNGLAAIDGVLPLSGSSSSYIDFSGNSRYATVIQHHGSRGNDGDAILTIKGNNETENNKYGGRLYVEGGNSTGVDGEAGSVIVAGGYGKIAGKVSILGGEGAASGRGGDIDVLGGNGGDHGGDIRIKSGKANSVGGSIGLYAGLLNLYPSDAAANINLYGASKFSEPDYSANGNIILTAANNSYGSGAKIILSGSVYEGAGNLYLDAGSSTYTNGKIYLGTLNANDIEIGYNQYSNVNVNSALVIKGSAYAESNINIYSGYGIVFSGDAPINGATIDSEVLDDYEEGTWTPGISGTGTGTDSITYNAGNGGIYTKIGRTVNIHGRIDIGTLTSVKSGNAIITGIPYAAKASSYVFTAVVGAYLSTGGGADITQTVQLNGNNSLLFLKRANDTYVSSSVWTSSTYLVFSLTYET